MLGQLSDYVEQNREIVHDLFQSYRSSGHKLILGSDLWDEFRQFCDLDPRHSPLKKSPLALALKKSQEAALNDRYMYLDIRPRVAHWIYLRYDFEAMTFEQVSTKTFLEFKEAIVSQGSELPQTLEIDFQPFERDFPKMNQIRSIGHGVEFLNRIFSNRLGSDLKKGDELLFSFLQLHGYADETFMINSSIRTVGELSDALINGLEFLDGKPGSLEWDDLENDLAQMGFKPGWGRTVDDITETMEILASLLEAPDHQNLEKFLSRIPMIFNIAILSPHGYFAQEDVLGLPDTGGQVVYILDQVRALEREMTDRIYQQGLKIKPQIVIITRLIPESGETTCHLKEEHVKGTENVHIMRVPFREPDGSIVSHWLSRFEVWPYIETFSTEAEVDLTSRLGRRPDLVIGNYSDGNLAAYIMAQRLGVTQCTIAHALEKTKYLYSALYWHDMEDQYHFSCQFTADLIAMNSSDFIITSTYQEIAGSSDVVGQYESYASFSMPSLQRVIHGIDVFDPKFNIVSPGADEQTFFSYSDEERRDPSQKKQLDHLIYGEPDHQSRGRLRGPKKRLLLSMARLDHIKNLTGLVEWYGNCKRLQEFADLVIIGGTVDSGQSADIEELDQIEKMHALFDQHQLDDRVRWLGVRLDKQLTGELYRYVADTGGAFVQPAFFEAFGLTVVEAMVSGLPTFATCYGGPLEIIQDSVSGYHIDPNHGDLAADKIADFFERCTAEPTLWHTLSNGASARIEERYTWKRYAERLLSLTCIYGFWKFATNLEREETNRYLEMFYHLQFKKRAEAMRSAA
ncbi:MAG: sucrose synthase [Desulfofustis sp.]|nr:sucrose synthase [Desulfofustis sp.]